MYTHYLKYKLDTCKYIRKRPLLTRMAYTLAKRD